MRLQDINLRNPITIGYYDPFSVFPVVQNDFLTKFPLSNLHWKYHPLKPVKSIPLLPVTLREEVPLTHSKKAPNELQNAVDDVYLRLIFVKSDNIDMYRSQVRPLINAWLADLVNGKDVSWAIVLVVPGAKRDKPSTLIKTSTYDKIKIDFGKGGKQLLDSENKPLSSTQDDDDDAGEEHEYIFKIKDSYSDDIQKLVVYNDMIGHFKYLLLQSFDKRFTTYNDQIELLRKVARDDPAMVSKFLYKLKLANILSDMKFLKESLDLYDELYEDMKVLLLVAPYAFDKKQILVHEMIDLNNFSPEVAFDTREIMSQFSRYCSHGEPISLFVSKSGLFLNLSLLLQSLANFATTISMSSIFILKLLQKLIYFINDISKDFPNSSFLNEWFFVMIDFYLNLPLTDKLMELNSQNMENDGASPLAEILEYLGELKLLKRGILGKLASLRGLDLPEIGFLLNEISLEDNKEETPEAVKPAYSPIAQALESQTSYEEFFEKLTVSAIQDFVSCDRTKTIDLLSVDLAILHYRRKQYKEALDILLNSYEYFIQNGWNFMGGVLLEIYLECIQKLEVSDHEHLLKTNLKLFATLKSNRVSSGINSYDLIKNRKQKKLLFERICSNSEQLEQPFEFPLDELFVASIKPFIGADEGTTDKYFLELNIENHFAFDILLSEISVDLVDLEGSFPLTFSAKNINLTPDVHHTISLYSNVFRKENYLLDKITVKPNHKLHLIQKAFDPPDHTSASDTVIHYGSSAIPEGRKNSTKTDQKCFMYHSPDKFRVEFVTPLKIELGASKLVLRIFNGMQEARIVDVTVSCATPELKFAEESEKFVIDGLNSSEVLEHSIAYTYYGENKTLALTADITYECNGERYEHHVSDTLDTSLTISISVQDLFRSNAIYSKFQIGSSRTKFPVRIMSCDLSCSDGKYNVSSLSNGICQSKSLVIFGEQPAFLFYKITPKDGLMSSSDSLDLTITFSNLRMECERAMEKALFKQVCDLELRKYYFLVESVVAKLKFNLNSHAIHRRLEVLNLEECGLYVDNLVTQFVPNPLERLKLTGLLASLFDNGEIATDDSLFEQQQLYIPVAVPVLGMLHKVEFEFDEKPQHLVGEPIEAVLKIQSTSKWKHKTKFSLEILASSSPAPTKAHHQAFQFTVHNEDSWLISGFKKLTFDVEDELSVSEFKITLIPLNVGKLQLPRVSIRGMDSKSKESMEIVHENGLESVLVVPELHSITFSF